MGEKIKQNKWWVRLVSETPDDFKFLRKVANRMGATALTLVSLSAAVTLPAWLITVSTIVLVACISITGTASFAKKG
jgi:hypothetical protein